MTGWECPRCGACYAPGVSQCFNCTGKIRTAGDATPAPTTWTINTNVCSACDQDRSLPASTGCPAGSHYGVELDWNYPDTLCTACGRSRKSFASASCPAEAHYGGGCG